MIGTNCFDWVRFGVRFGESYLKKNEMFFRTFESMENFFFYRGSLDVEDLKAEMQH